MKNPEGVAMVKMTMAELADAIHELAGKIDPSNHVYAVDDCDPAAEARDYRAQADRLFDLAAFALDRIPSDSICVGDAVPGPHGIGSPSCDTLWATSDALDAHLRDVHHTTYEEAIAPQWKSGSAS